MLIVFRILIGIAGGLIAVKLSKNKKYEETIAFIIGFLFPFIGNAIIYYSKDNKEEHTEEKTKEDKALEILIDRLNNEK